MGKCYFFPMKALRIRPFLHLFAWALLLFMPALAGLQSQDPHFHIPTRDLWRMGILCAVFYLNYLWLIPHHFLKGRRALFFFANLLLAVVLHFMLHQGGPPPVPPEMVGPPRFRERPVLLMAFSSFLLISLTTGMALAIRMTEQWFHDQKRKASRETEHLKSELSYLKLQLSPHFLLNTLNNIYSLTGQDATKAQKALHHLGKLLRYLLYETEADHVPLQGEVGFLRSYIELMQLRIAAHVHVECDLDRQPPHILVAPLIFLPLVENAFKHGVHPSSASQIVIRLHVMDSHLVFHTINSYNPKGGADQSGSGVGLANLRKRLELIYPNQYQYSTKVEDGLYYAQLEITLENSHG